MPTQFFRHHHDYSQLLSGAHRKPATVIDTPTAIRHLAFWQPTIAGKYDEKARTTWKSNADDYIIALYHRLQALQASTTDLTSNELNIIYGFTCQNRSNKDFDKSRYIFFLDKVFDREEGRVKRPSDLPADLHRDFVYDYQAIIFGFYWNHILVKLRFELHQEYLLMTTFLDFSALPVVDGEGVITLEQAKKNSIFRTAFEKYAELNSLLTSKSQDAARYKDIHAWFYNTIWHFLIKEIFLSEKGADPDGVTLLDRAQQLGHVFADFRGLVLTQPRPEDAQQGLDFFQMPAWRRRRSPRDFSSSAPLSNNEAATILQTLFPFVTSDPRIPFKEYELTASRMLKGRIVYVTALGAQPSLYLAGEGEEASHVPLYYLIYSHTVRHWQIGRLVDRIHQLGTVRIAAIQELRELRGAAAKIREISHEVDLATRQRDMYDPEASESALALITKAQRELAGIGNGFIGGLLYRIERSRYYVKQFRENVPVLRIRRIEGFQPYNSFVERRLGATFDFIDLLGRRHDRLQQQLNLQYQFLLAKNGIEVSRQIERRNEKIEDIQAAAEVFFWAVPAPYYLIHVIDHIFHPAAEVGYAILALCWMYALYRYIYLKIDRR